MNAKMFGIYIRCSCGEILHAESKIDDESNEPYFVVEPCERCTQQENYGAFDAGFSKGYDMGFKEGRELIDKGGLK